MNSQLSATSQSQIRNCAGKRSDPNIPNYPQPEEPQLATAGPCGAGLVNLPIIHRLILINYRSGRFAPVLPFWKPVANHLIANGETVIISPRTANPPPLNFENSSESGFKIRPKIDEQNPRIDYHEDTRGLRAFLEKTVYNAPFGLLVTLNDDVTVPDPRIIPISLSSFMWIR